jgi:hypothetical protein
MKKITFLSILAIVVAVTQFASISTVFGKDTDASSSRAYKAPGFDRLRTVSLQLSPNDTDAVLTIREGVLGQRNVYETISRKHLLFMNLKMLFRDTSKLTCAVGKGIRILSLPIIKITILNRYFYYLATFVSWHVFVMCMAAEYADNINKYRNSVENWFTNTGFNVKAMIVFLGACLARCIILIGQNPFTFINSVFNIISMVFTMSRQPLD